MIRNIIVFLLCLFGLFFAGSYLAYGQIDPCRALAVEQARRAPVPTAMAELWTRIATSGMNRPACSKQLVLSWWERLTQ